MNKLSSLRIFKNIYFLIRNPVLQENECLYAIFKISMTILYPKKNFDKMFTLKFKKKKNYFHKNSSSSHNSN